MQRSKSARLTWHLMYGVHWASTQMKLPREKPKSHLKMKEKSAGHFLDGFGIFGPRRIQPRSFKAKILLLQDFDVRFAQTTST